MSGPARIEPLHDSAELHVQGRALYIEDMPRLEGELALATVGAPCARGRITAVRLKPARAVPGVVAVLDHRDIPGRNLWGPIHEDEPFLVAEEIGYLGQPVAIVVAESRAAALAGCAAVVIEAVPEPPVLSIEEADRRGHYLGVERFIRRGDVAIGRAAAHHRIEGVFESGGQEQFYLESQAALAIPGEAASMVVHSSTQNPTEIQKVVAEALGWRQNQVVCVCQRMGGAFGGKETQGALPAVFAALAAWKCGRPVRVVYTKDEDMQLTGKRHPVRTAYSVGCDEAGRILDAAFVVRSNGGAYADLSTAVLERTMLHLDNAYYLPHVAIAARVCRTNLPPNTAFRGFGGPQAMAVIENVMEEIALTLGLEALDVRRANLYDSDSESDRTVTPYGQRLAHNRLPEIFDRLEASSGYRERRARIEASNGRVPIALRGLALVPVKFGISFTNKMLNQANALVNVYTDGTVQVSTGATEMGQGVNTKLALIVAAELGISYEHVLVMPTSTEKNNNTSPTAASASTDLNGSAAVDACRQIRARLVELAADLFANSADPADPSSRRERSPADVRFGDDRCWDARSPGGKGLSFAELTRRARIERVDLGARGFFATPNIGFDRETGQGTPFAYYTTGACVAEVTVDRLLGTLQVDRLDVLMDVGRPIHRGIELGQIYGGLVQGIGWVTTEELVYDERGFLLSHSPTTYKIPNITDVAPEFHVDLLADDLAPQILRSTKAVGEPPLMLGIAVWCAVKNALSYCDATAGGRPRAIPALALPATQEAIARAAQGLSS